jgi:hypothetical protein
MPELFPPAVATVQAILASYGTATATATSTATATATYTPTPSGPTLVSATVQADGHTLVCVFSVAVTSTVWTGACTFFQFATSGGYATLGGLPCYISGDNTTTIALDLGATDTVCPGLPVLLKYTRALGATDVKATSGGAFLANFTDFVCVNNAAGCG